MTIEAEPTHQPRGPWPRPLYDLTLAVAAARHPDDIFEAALSALGASLGLDRASILLFDAHGVMRFKASRGISEAYRAAVEGHSPWTPDTVGARPVLVEDVAAEPTLAGLRDTILEEGIHALAFVPLALGDRLLGKFMLYYDVPHVFSDEEIACAETIAAHVAFAIDQHRHRESEQRYRSLISAVGVALYTTDAAGRINYFNEEACALWGRRPRIGVDRWCGSWRLYRPDGSELPLDECPMAMTIRTGRPVRDQEIISERPDGTRAHIIPCPTPLRDTDGNLVGAINVMVDITARKHAEMALEEKERHLREALAEKEQLLADGERAILLHELMQAQLASLIEASSALIDSPRQDEAVSAILRIASALLKAHAYAIWEFFEEREQWEIVVSTGLSEDYVARSVIRDREGRRDLERPLVVEDVSQVPLIENLLPRYQREGVCSLFVLPLQLGGGRAGTLTFYYRVPHQFSDLEVRVGLALANLASASMTATRIAQDLRVANAAKDEFLGLVSHELKTPLTMIRGNAEVLLRENGKFDATTRHAALADIVAESERLHRIIENLLLLARAERGQLTVGEPVLLARVIRRVVARHSQHRPHRRIEVVEHGVPRPIMFSDDLLEQVIENLLTNAEKYSPPGEPVVIDIDRRGGDVITRVLDRGKGVDPAEVDQLFAPFYRSPSNRSQSEGLGIGLAVCKRLVESQGGRMWVQQRPDGGAEFGFSLPAISDDEDDPAEDQESA